MNDGVGSSWLFVQKWLKFGLSWLPAFFFSKGVAQKGAAGICNSVVIFGANRDELKEAR